MNAALISWFCFNLIGAPGSYGPACAKATEATTYTIGVKRDLDQVEGYFRDESQKRFSPTILGIGGAAYSVVVKRQLNLKFRAAPWVSRITLTGNQSSGAMGLTWEF